MQEIEAYQAGTVTAQNKGRLIVLLYDGAIKFMTLAIKELEANNDEAKERYINKALDIIKELDVILSVNTGDEMASNLRKLYCVMTKQLAEANIKCDPQIIQGVIKLVEELNQSWKAISI